MHNTGRSVPQHQGVLFPVAGGRPGPFESRGQPPHCPPVRVASPAWSPPASPQHGLVLQGIKKPYNPVLGEMFRCCRIHPQTRSCTFYTAEQARPPLGREPGRWGVQGGPCVRVPVSPLLPIPRALEPDAAHGLSEKVQTEPRACDSKVSPGEPGTERPGPMGHSG